MLLLLLSQLAVELLGDELAAGRDLLPVVGWHLACAVLDGVRGWLARGYEGLILGDNLVFLLLED